MLESLAENLPSPPISTGLFLSAPITDQRTIHAAIESDNEYILPDKAVAMIFSHLPIKDVFRFGFKLSKGWLDARKSLPLVLHDAQLIPDHLKAKIVKGGLFRYNIASNITRVLDLHPGPVAYMRLEYTTWKGGNTQVRLWIEKLITKGVNELLLFGRRLQGVMDVLPNNISTAVS